jgi:hypothetical protein
MSWRRQLLHGPMGEFPLRGGAPAMAAGEPKPGAQPVSAPGSRSPGDQAPPGTPGTGENVCPRCGGRGKLDAGQRCPECEGTGRVTTGIGGA